MDHLAAVALVSGEVLEGVELGRQGGSLARRAILDSDAVDRSVPHTGLRSNSQSLVERVERLDLAHQRQARLLIQERALALRSRVL